jgi:Trk-type K+ transport system membrane component
MKSSGLAPSAAFGVAAAAIIIGTVVGVILTFSIDSPDNDGWFRWMLPGTLAFVSIIATAQARFLLIPRMLSDEVLSRAQSLDHGKTAAAIVTAMYAAANGPYAVVAAWWSASAFAALALGVLGFITIAVNAPYLTERLREVDTRQRIEGATSP